MNTKLAGLVMVAAVLAGVVWQLQRGPQSEESVLLLSELGDRLGEVHAVAIVSGGDARVSMEKNSENAWVVVEKSGYPVKFEKLSGFLRGLSENTVAEYRTRKPQLHAALGLSRAGVSAGTRVTLQLENEEIELLVGSDGQSRGTHVLLGDDPQVLLTRQRIRAVPDPLDWIDRVIINVPAEEILGVTVTGKDPLPLVVNRSKESGEFQVTDLPSGRQLKYETIVDGFGRLLTNPRFENVALLDESMFDAAITTRFELRDGSVIVARSAEFENGYWLHLDHETTKSWQYAVSAYTFGEFTKAVEDLLEENEDGQ